MFRLPVCPHCHTVYRYGDVKKVSKKKIEKCYHCKKDFKVSKSGILILLLIVIAIGIEVNIFQINVFNNINFAVMFVTNIVLVIMAVLFLPFFVSFKKNKR